MIIPRSIGTHLVSSKVNTQLCESDHLGPSVILQLIITVKQVTGTSFATVSRSYSASIHSEVSILGDILSRFEPTSLSGKADALPFRPNR